MTCGDCGREVDSCICGAFGRFKNSPEYRGLREFFTCRSLPPAGDRGQRYEVRYTDEDGKDCVLGWSESYPQNYIDAINAHPAWHSPRVIDRRPR